MFFSLPHCPFSQRWLSRHLCLDVDSLTSARVEMAASTAGSTIVHFDLLRRKPKGINSPSEKRGRQNVYKAIASVRVGRNRNVHASDFMQRHVKAHAQGQWHLRRPAAMSGSLAAGEAPLEWRRRRWCRLWPPITRLFGLKLAIGDGRGCTQFAIPRAHNRLARLTATLPRSLTPLKSSRCQ